MVLGVAYVTLRMCHLTFGSRVKCSLKSPMYSPYNLIYTLVRALKMYLILRIVYD